MRTVALALMLLATVAAAEWRHDGALDDWPADALRVDDPAGDPHKPGHGELPGRDLTELVASVDAHALRVGVGFSSVESGDEEAGLLLLIDADRNPSTGHSREGLGCELIWDIGLREGEVFLEDFSGPVKGAKELREFLGILVAPTVTAPAVEVWLPRGDHELFRDRAFHLVVHDERSDDRAPDDGSFTLVWPEAADPVAPIPLERHHDAAFRFVAWNVEHDGLFATDDAVRQAALRRVLGALDTDMWVLNEVWDHDGEQVRARLGELLGRDLSSWSAVRRDGGNVLLSRFEVVESWEVIDDVEGDDPRDRHRVTAARLATPGRDALVIASHWRCCDADAERQIEADGTMRFLRDAFTPGGRLDLPADTPVIVAGDFNLVRLREQLDTLLTGDVVDEARFGADVAPALVDLDDVPLRHAQWPLVHTWHVPDSSFGPGRLDWVFVNTAVDPVRHLILDTARLDDEALARSGLEREDTRVASDHFPLVVDVRWR